MPDCRPILHVCVTCRAGQTQTETDTDTDIERQPTPGQRLHDALARRAGIDGPVVIQPVTCLASCDHGCAVAIGSPGKWTYLLGRLGPDHADDLIAYGEIYAANRTGAVMPSRRPQSLNGTVLGRVPSPVSEPAA